MTARIAGVGRLDRTESATAQIEHLSETIPAVQARQVEAAYRPVRLSAGELACTLSALAVRIHVSAQERIHARLVAAPLRTEPLDDIRIDTQGK